MFRVLIFILSFLFFTNIDAAGNDARIGISVGGINWGRGLFGIEYDQKGIIKQANWTAGGELDLLGGGFLLSPRALYWQKTNISGFYGGPMVSVGVVQDGHYNHSYENNYDNFLVGIGGEGGWLYRFPMKFDLGAAVDLSATNYGMWLGLKITAGYLIH